MSWIGDAALTYKMLKNTTFTLIASSVDLSSVVGSLFKFDADAVSRRFLNHYHQYTLLAIILRVRKRNDFNHDKRLSRRAP